MQQLSRGWKEYCRYLRKLITQVEFSESFFEITSGACYFYGNIWAVFPTVVATVCSSLFESHNTPSHNVKQKSQLLLSNYMTYHQVAL